MGLYEQELDKTRPAFSDRAHCAMFTVRHEGVATAAHDGISQPYVGEIDVRWVEAFSPPPGQWCFAR